MTHTNGARAARIPATTAPPRPPWRSSGRRWIRYTARVDSIARIASGVSSSLSSTKMTSIGRSGSTRSSRATSGPTFPASARVGTTTETAGVWPFRLRPVPRQRRPPPVGMTPFSRDRARET